MQVPSYNNNAPSVTDSGQGPGGIAELPNQTFDYGRTMEQAMQPLEHGANAIIKAEEKFRAQMIKARVDESLTAAEQEVEDILYNPQTGFFAKNGNAPNLDFKDTLDAVSKVYTRHGAQLDNPQAQQAFESYSSQLISATRNKMIGHRNKQAGIYFADQSQARIDSLVKSCAENWNDKELFEGNLASINRERQYQAQLLGEPPEITEKKDQAIYDLIQSNRFVVQAQEDPKGALDAFYKVRDSMSFDTRIKLQNQLVIQAAHTLASEIQRNGGITYQNLSKRPLPKDVDERVGSTMGYRFNNPLNLRSTKDQWEGKVGSENGFVVFSTPEKGIRAAAKTLQNYSKRGLNTVVDIVSTWAPASDKNDTDSYVLAVCKETGFEQTQKLDLKDEATLKKLLSAMMKVEIGGNPYPQSVIDDGLASLFGRVSKKEEAVAPSLLSKDFSEKYNTALSPEMENQFQEWAKSNGKLGDLFNYDLRGWYKEQIEAGGSVDLKGGQHLTDKWKKPNHPTISEESIYNGKDGVVGGKWLHENGKDVFLIQSNISKADAEELKSYFAKHERGVELRFAKEPSENYRITIDELKANPDLFTGNSTLDQMTTQQRAMVYAKVKKLQAAKSSELQGKLKDDVQNSLAIALEEGDVTYKLTKDRFIEVYGQDAENEYTKYSGQFDSRVERFEMTTLSDPEIQQRIDNTKVSKNSSNYSQSLKDRELEEATAQVIRSERMKDPVGYSLKKDNAYGFNEIKNPTDLVGFANEISNRADRYLDLSQKYRTPPALLSGTEAARIGAYLANSSPDQRADYLTVLANRFNEADKKHVLQVLSKDLEKINPAFSMALGLATQEYAYSNKIPNAIIWGADLRQRKAVEIKDDVVREAKTRASQIFKHSRSAARDIPELEETLLNVYAARKFADSSYRMENAVKEVIGEPIEHNSSVVVAPNYGGGLKPNLAFRDLLEVFIRKKIPNDAKFTIAGKEYDKDGFAQHIRKGELQWVGNGKYIVRASDGFVTDPKDRSKNYVIDLYELGRPAPLAEFSSPIVNIGDDA